MVTLRLTLVDTTSEKLCDPREDFFNEEYEGCPRLVRANLIQGKE